MDIRGKNYIYIYINIYLFIYPCINSDLLRELLKYFLNLDFLLSILTEYQDGQMYL